MILLSNSRFRENSAVIQSLLAAILAVSTSACAGLLESLKPPPPQPITVGYKMPVIAPVAEVKQSLSKGGIMISVTPATYVEVSNSKTDEIEVDRGITCRRLKQGVEVTPTRRLRTTISPQYGVNPDRLVFLLKINNQMSRVFRGAGAVVQFNVGGRLVSVPQGQYAELSNLLLPPRNEADVHVVGPPLESITDGATVGLFLYDVVTRTDAAGNVTEKQNFEWYYNYRTNAVVREGVVQTTTRNEAIGPSRVSNACR